METNLPTELLEALRRDAGGSALILTGGGNLTAAAQAARSEEHTSELQSRKEK